MKRRSRGLAAAAIGLIALLVVAAPAVAKDRAERPNVIVVMADDQDFRRLVRSTTLVVRQQPYVESARSIGLKDHIILFRYIFMNSLSPLIVQCTFVIAYATEIK